MGFSRACKIGLGEKLLYWWASNGRHDLPWKSDSILFASALTNIPSGSFHPYPIWIAEVMLQQTQVGVMLPYWHKWMTKFPNVNLLERASLEEVLLVWQGLGYYARARNLHKASKQIIKHSWPLTLEGWMAIPGIGRTTAGGILSSAFDFPYPILDGNVRRVLSRLQACPDPPQKILPILWKWSETLLDRERPRDFNQALMDLGALICTPRNPKCSLCPWKKNCRAYSLDKSGSFPVKMTSKSLSTAVVGVGIVLNDSGEVLIDQRLNDGLLGGLWEFPGGKQEPEELITKTIVREMQEELSITVEVGEELISFDHTYSHKKIHFEVYLCTLIKGIPKPLASQKVKWVRPESLHEYPFPAANVHIINALKKRLLEDKSQKAS